MDWILGGKLAVSSTFSISTGYICLTSPPSQDHGSCFSITENRRLTSWQGRQAAGSCSSKAFWRFSGLGSTGLWQATLMEGALGRQLRKHPWKDRGKGDSGAASHLSHFYIVMLPVSQLSPVRRHSGHKGKNQVEHLRNQPMSPFLLSLELAYFLSSYWPM